MLTTRDKLLGEFGRHPGQTLSGTSLARRLGLTRASVWKHMEALKEAGLPVQSVPRGGYRFHEDFDFSLHHLASKNHLPGGWKLHYEFRLASTQTRAKRAAELNIPPKHIWVAETQSAGRGRLDRSWDSSSGGLWMSLLLRPRLAPAQVPALSLVAALKMIEAVQQVFAIKLSLKWPNDLITASNGWKKVGGILTEMSGEMDRTHWVVIGMGLNINNQLAASLRGIGISLASLGKRQRALSRGTLLEVFVKKFEFALREFEKDGFRVFQQTYWRHYGRPDEPVALKTAQGIIRGRARGVDDRGALIVESHGQAHHLFEGEIIP